MYLPTISDGTQGYLYTNWECVPGGVSKLYISQDADGSWTTADGDLVDFTVLGTQNNCNASVTPWNTALTSEEYPPDVQEEYDYWVATRDMLAAQVGHDPDPLEHGYIVELTPAGGEEGGLNTIAQKHYAMGRFSHEMALVMPDEQTVYFGDDGTDRVLYKFIADNAADLSAGTLYAAKVTQAGEALDYTWIELGSGNDADIKAGIEAMAAA
jgi:secreted PhoX family phosphatase